MRKTVPPTNPFTFGALALDDAFTDRERELKRARGGHRERPGRRPLRPAPLRQVVARRARGAAGAPPTRSSSATATSCGRRRRSDSPPRSRRRSTRTSSRRASRWSSGRPKLFRGLRVTPTMEIDPDDAHAALHVPRPAAAPTRHRRHDRAAARAAGQDRAPSASGASRSSSTSSRRSSALDRNFPNLMRAVFQTQPEVGHVYLGSKRHVLERIFNDKNEPFWRSAKQDRARPDRRRRSSPPSSASASTQTEKGITDDALERLLEVTARASVRDAGARVLRLGARADRAPRVPRRRRVGARPGAALGAQPLREHLGRGAAGAAAADARARRGAGGGGLLGGYRGRHELPGPSSVGIALQALEKKEIAGRADDGTRVHRRAVSRGVATTRADAGLSSCSLQTSRKASATADRTASRRRPRSRSARARRRARAVRTRRGHRVERVGDREKPRLERDRPAAQAGGIAAAVPALVMEEDVRQRWPRAPERQDEVGARARMAADLAELVERSAARSSAAGRARIETLPMSWSGAPKRSAAIRSASQPSCSATGSASAATRAPCP